MPQLIRSTLVALAMCCAVPALAKPGSDFRATYERGMALFNAKDFANARAEFLAAYALQPEPTVLFAIAQTYRFEGNFKEAVTWYQKFLADSQAAQDLRAEAQTYLDESMARLNEIEEARRKAAEAGPKEVDGRPATMPDGAASPTAQPTPVAPLDSPTPAPITDSVRERRIPLGSKIAAGVTGASLITAIVVTVRGLDVEDQFAQRRAANTATQADADRVEHYQTGINLAWGVTAAAAVTSVAIYFAAPSYAMQQRVAVAPRGDGGWTASVTARF